MPCPHLRITIVKRSKGQSAVAAAAYQSGDALYSEHDQARKAYSEKKGIVYKEIMLCAHAPPEYADRNKLWNAAEAIERQWNAQLARKIVLALPNEVSQDQYVAMLRDYCAEHFVSKGMCADFAIHDKGDGNPHAHILLTMHGIDENGRWLPKCRKEYLLDENGERIRLPSGEWKTKRINTNDWNEQSKAEVWRQGWADIQNRYLERCESPARVDLRSYERQGIDKIPMVHMGPAACMLEKKGVRTNLGNLNYEISNANRLMQQIKATIRKLKDWITELTAEKQRMEHAPTLLELMQRYLDVRRAERANWSGRAQLNGTVNDFNRLQETLWYMRENKISTTEEFEARLQKCEAAAAGLRAQIRENDQLSKHNQSLIDACSDYRSNRSVHVEHQKIFFKRSKEKYYQEHKEELNSFNRALRFLLKNGGRMLDGKLVFDDCDLMPEHYALGRQKHELEGELSEINFDLENLRQIRYYIDHSAKQITVRPIPIQPELQAMVNELEQKQKAKRREQNER